MRARAKKVGGARRKGRKHTGSDLVKKAAHACSSTVTSRLGGKASANYAAAECMFKPQTAVEMRSMSEDDRWKARRDRFLRLMRAKRKHSAKLRKARGTVNMSAFASQGGSSTKISRCKIELNMVAVVAASCTGKSTMANRHGWIDIDKCVCDDSAMLDALACERGAALRTQNWSGHNWLFWSHTSEVLASLDQERRRVLMVHSADHARYLGIMSLR